MLLFFFFFLASLLTCESVYICNWDGEVIGLKGTLTALAAFSKHQLLDMLRSAALISPIAHLGKVTSPIARNAADNFLGEV